MQVAEGDVDDQEFTDLDASELSAGETDEDSESR